MGRTKRMVRDSFLISAALVVYVIEAQLPPLAPVPGIKLGLANIFTVYAVFAVGAGDGLAVLLARVILGSVFTAQPSALIYSLSGGLASFGLTVLLRRFFDSHRIWICSALAAAVHNLFQLLAAVAVTGTPSLMVYLPVLTVSGIVTGIFTGLCAGFVIDRRDKTDFDRK